MQTKAQLVVENMYLRRLLILQNKAINSAIGDYNEIIANLRESLDKIQLEVDSHDDNKR